CWSGSGRHLWKAVALALRYNTQRRPGRKTGPPILWLVSSPGT
ncbi:MAG: hypothetical protein AVDCRST_MAG80-2292, partial [uncultured Rubrobacteraceae bacterium]